jgi:hypothetical protein
MLMLRRYCKKAVAATQLRSHLTYRSRKIRSEMVPMANWPTVQPPILTRGWEEIQANS